MSTYYYMVLAVAGLLALPMLFTPVGWTVAVVAIVVWLVIAVGGRYLVGEYWDLKKKRETGMRKDSVSDKIRGSDDGRWNR